MAEQLLLVRIKITHLKSADVYGIRPPSVKSEPYNTGLCPKNAVCRLSPLCIGSPMVLFLGNSWLRAEQLHGCIEEGQLDKQEMHRWNVQVIASISKPWVALSCD